MSASQGLNDCSRGYATQLDNQDTLRHLRKEFIIPTKADLKSKTLANSASTSENDDQPCIYFCGNSLGLQPRRTSERIISHLTSWAKKGVYGHFTQHEDSNLPPYLHVDDFAAKLMAPLVGALPKEVALMQTLTANLHLMMASFYRPTEDKYKIILEGKAFPSDHYAVESQIRHHGFDPKEAMILIEPESSGSPTISESHILSIIEKHASSTALILLPGVQYYTGQYLDIERITSYAHNLGLTVGWDLAHAVGNVPLQLHGWNVDFAVWCNYKYIDSGPGVIGGLFVHSRHGEVDLSARQDGGAGFRPRLSGWWGGDKDTRFKMDSDFVPIPGAPGFQLSNPSVLDLTAVIASLEVFALTSMAAIREKSIALTSYLEDLLLLAPAAAEFDEKCLPYQIITPSNIAERGAQLSLLLKPGLLEGVMKALEDAGVVVDERRPNVIRVAPAPLYNTFTEVWEFVHIFKVACLKAQSGRANGGQEVIALKRQDEKCWA
ncbi:hypothetical protein ABVK25_002107 [Lepraria finkii]|uniref:Kynureninase n=1 Tax=Lepraria finkii TaxID=1340010 RepID=A0ABR4BJ72_9LECA